jgi:hypothetical protein
MHIYAELYEQQHQSHKQLYACVTISIKQLYKNIPRTCRKPILKSDIHAIHPPDPRACRRACRNQSAAPAARPQPSGCAVGNMAAPAAHTTSRLRMRQHRHLWQLAPNLPTAPEATPGGSSTSPQTSRLCQRQRWQLQQLAPNLPVAPEATPATRPNIPTAQVDEETPAACPHPPSCAASRWQLYPLPRSSRRPHHA